MLTTSTTRPPGEPKSYDVRRMFREVAGRCPASPAIRSGDRRITYGELDLASDRVGAALRERGVGRDAAAAILAERSEDVICGVLGALKAGALFVPLDPRTPPRRLEAMLEVVAPAAVLTGEDLGSMLAGASGAVPANEPLELEDLGPDDSCYLYFTSGSTGKPKAITGRFKGIAHFIRWEIETLGVEEGWRVSQLIHPSFDAFLRDIFVPLCAGGTICVPPDRETIADARRLLAWLGEEEIRLIHCVPSLFRTLLHGETLPLPALRYVLMSGEPLLPADVRRWTERHGTATRLVNLYGPSETTMTKLVYFVEPADGDRRTIPIGQPMPGARALVLDPHGQVCPPRAVGEIYIRTPYRSLGYYGRPDLTAEVFVRNPFTQDPDDLIYKTGDLGRVLDDGNFEFLGRKDSQVKIRGVRIEIAEIESLLLSHPRVRETAVVDLDDPEGTKFLCAYVVLDDEAGPAGLRDFLAESLPEHSLPSAVVVLDELPRTLSGKIDRRALPLPERVREARGLDLDPPRSPTEEIVAGLFAQVLGLGRVGPHEGFFELGGHSLLATRVLTRVRSAFDVEVPLRAFFEAPTVAGLAADIERRRRPDGAPAVPTISAFLQDRSSPPPLSFGQERFWNGRQREARAVPATVPMLVAFAGPLDPACLRRALQEVVDRHEMLRTTFRDDDAGPVQVVHPALPVQLPLIDLERIAPLDQRAEIRLWSAHDARSPFDYERGPLFRAILFRCSERESLALFTVHHVAFDGWSQSILIDEVSTLYNAFRADGPSPLRPLAAQYQDFARWQRQTFAGEALAEQVTFWREHLRGAVPVDLCGDRPRPIPPTFAAGSEELLVPEELERKLETFAAEQGATLFMTLLAAFKALLRHETGQDDLVVTCLFANRNQPEIENLIGYFSAGMPLRTSGARTFRELLERVRAVTLSAHEHPYVLYEQVLDGASFLKPGDHGGITSFRVMFQLAKMPPAGQDLSDVRVTRLPLDTGRIGQDLTLFLGQADRLGGRFRYNRDVLDPEMAAGLRDRFLQILAVAVAEPDRPLEEMLSPVRRDDPADRRAARAMPESENAVLA